MKKYLLLSLSIIGLMGYGQQEIDQSKVSDQLLDHRGNISSIDLRDKNLVGSMYVNDTFLPAKLSNNNTIYSANYNAFQDEMVINKDGKLFTVAKTFNNEISFVGIDKVYKAFNFDDDGKVKKGFFVIKSKGKELSVLKKEKVKFYEAVEPNTGYEKYKPPTLKRESDKLYVGFKDHTAKEIPNKKKEIYNLFVGKVKEMEKYAKNQKLNPKKEEDIQKMATYYNSLF